MNTPQEQIAEYLMDYWPGASFEQLRNHAAKICKLFTPTVAELEARCAKMREALVGIRNWQDRIGDPSEYVIDQMANCAKKALSSDCGKELLDRLNKLEQENAELNKALALKLDAMPSGLSAGQSKVLEDRLKTAASMLRSAVYERTPPGDKWIDHFDNERQKAITEFLASVEGKP